MVEETKNSTNKVVATPTTLPQRTPGLTLELDWENMNKIVSKIADEGIKTSLKELLEIVQEKAQDFKEDADNRLMSNQKLEEALEDLETQVKREEESIKATDITSKRRAEAVLAHLKTVCTRTKTGLLLSIAPVQLKPAVTWQDHCLRFEQKQLQTDPFVAKFTKVLEAIARESRPKYRQPNGVFICYAWPKLESEQKKYLHWVKPFLKGLRHHLHQAGLVLTKLNIVDHPPGGSIEEYMRGARTSDFVLLIGTEDLLLKYEEGSSDVCSELADIRRKRKADKKNGLSSRVFPLLISGDYPDAFPPEYDWADWETSPKTYFELLRSLIPALYSTQEVAFGKIWEEKFLSHLDVGQKMLVTQRLTQQDIEARLKAEADKKKEDDTARDQTARALLEEKTPAHPSSPVVIARGLAPKNAAGASERKLGSSLFSEDWKQIDTPNDHNCLFWSAALGLLLSCREDEIAFNQMYDRLFGTGPLPLEGIEEKKSENLISIEALDTKNGVRNILHTYDCGKDSPLGYEGDVLKTLVCAVFRGRVVNELSKVFLDEKDRDPILLTAQIDNPRIKDWATYTDAMREPTAWGGDAEIRAISHLAQVNIRVASAGSKDIPYQFPDSTQTLYLAHVNAKNKVGGNKNHYHYGLSRTIYDKLITNQKHSATSTAVFLSALSSNGGVPQPKNKDKAEREGKSSLSLDHGISPSASGQEQEHKKEKNISSPTAGSTPYSSSSLSIPPSVPSVSVDVNDFKKVFDAESLIIDKSLLIQDVLEGASVKLIICPSSFGKTFNLSMLKYFFEGRGDKVDKTHAYLFKSRAIWTVNEGGCQKHHGKYPVIFISFSTISQFSKLEEAYDELEHILSRLYQRHAGDLISILNNDKDGKTVYEEIINRKAEKGNFHDALRRLTGYLQTAYGEPVIILIDEYDTPLYAGYAGQPQYFKEIAVPIQRLLARALKDNDHLYKAILTGNLRADEKSIFTGFNNIHLYNVLSDDFGAYFGFSDAEVRQLLGSEMTVELFDKLKQWYGGYHIGKEKQSHIFNPWSLVNFSTNLRKYKKEKYQEYWTSNFKHSLIKDILQKRIKEKEINESFSILLRRESIQQEIDENTVFHDIYSKITALWSFLLFNGYLAYTNYDDSDKGTKICTLKIPNEELYRFYHTLLREFIASSYSAPAGLGDHNHPITTLSSEEKKSVPPMLIEDWGARDDRDSYYLCKVGNDKIKIELKLKHSKNQKDSYRVLYQALSGCGQNLQYLDLSENALDDLSALTIAHFLQEFPHELHTLHLSHNRITSEGLEFILKALVKKPSIQFLFLDNNYIDFERYFCEEILEPSVKKAGLKHLDLSMNFICEGEALQEVGIRGRPIRIVRDPRKPAHKIEEKRQYYCKQLLENPSSITKSYPAKSSQSVRSILEPREKLDENSGIVSLFAFKTVLPPLGEHAFLAVEGIHDFGQRFIIMGDLFAIGKEVMISIAHCSPQEYLDRTSNREVWSQSACKSKEIIKKLISEMIESRSNQDFYHYRLLPNFKDDGVFNCYNWAKKILKSIGIDIPDGVVPSWILGKGERSNTMNRCVIS